MISSPASLPERFVHILRDIQDYHMEPSEAARIAEQAGVKTLELVHITPLLLNYAVEVVYMEGISDIFKGNIILAQDRMKFSLKPK